MNCVLPGHRLSPWRKFIISSVPFSSVQDGIYALGKTHMRSTPSLRSFPALPLNEFITKHDQLLANSSRGGRLRGLQAGTSEAAMKTCMGRLWDQSVGGRHPVAARHPPPAAAAADDRVSAEWARGRCVDQCQRVNTEDGRGPPISRALLFPWASCFTPVSYTHLTLPTRSTV